MAEARKLFADKGFDGTSVRDLTSRAGANLGAITYHFGSKRHLYDAVLDELLGSFADHIERTTSGPGGAAERLKQVVHTIFRFFTDHPEAPPMLLRVLAREGGPPPVAVKHARRNLAAITAVVREGQQGGELRDIEPVLATFTILSQSIWFALVRRQLATVTGMPLEQPEQSTVMEHHIRDVVTRAFVHEGEEG